MNIICLYLFTLFSKLGEKMSNYFEFDKKIENSVDKVVNNL